MKALKINPTTRTTEFAEMTDAEILRFVGGYIVEMTDLNNGLAVHADLISNGHKFVIDDIVFAGNAVITGITGHGISTDCPDDVFPVIEWKKYYTQNTPNTTPKRSTQMNKVISKPQFPQMWNHDNKYIGKILANHKFMFINLTFVFSPAEEDGQKFYDVEVTLYSNDGGDALFDSVLFRYKTNGFKRDDLKKIMNEFIEKYDFNYYVVCNVLKNIESA